MPVWVRLMRAFHRHLALMSWGALFGIVLLHSLVSWELMVLAGEEKLVTLTDWFYYYVVTATTIGYGDMTPITLPGRMLGAVIAIVGIGMFALPAGLLGAAFVDELGKARARAGARTEPGAPCGGACPHCGKPLP